MIQELLANRFGLDAHFETRELPALALIVAKRSPSLQNGEPPPARPKGEKGSWPAPIESHRDPRGMVIDAHGASMGQLVQWLQFYFGKRFIDQTRIAGTYNFMLQFHGSLSEMQADDESMWPPVETAIREQLGLQLKDTRAPQQVLVIDHIQMPTPN